MNNDFLRLNNVTAQTDTSVNKYSVKSAQKKKTSRTDGNSALSLIIDEVYDGDSGLIYNERVQKPKIIDSIAFSFVYLVVIMAFMLLVEAKANLFLIYVLAIISAILVPVSLVYFFYRLDVRGRLKFSSIIYLVSVGFVVYVFIDFIFKRFVGETLSFYMYVITIRSAIELLSIVLISIFVIKNKSKCSRMTAILIACAVSSGFAVAEALSGNLSAMFVSVEVHQLGSSVGAILNMNSFIQRSATNLLNQIADTAFLQPLMFVMLITILVKIFVNDEWSIRKRSVTIVFTFLFCAVTHALTNISTPFNVLSILYNVVSIAFTLYLFGKMLNNTIKAEKYE